MTRLALFYYAGKKITPKEQIAEFIKYFDGVVLLSTDEGKYSDFSTLLSDMKKFVAESGLGFEIGWKSRIMMLLKHPGLSRI
ncbi:hypothetical protein [Palaeococcus ferrophilus]|uniref:hypothetical protein n=1 Tax=Palaeococcus ferrophilus TaxID=83868 RepID=UPI00064E8773|nr:hypothetical protein [Palaeococcus ferrophilus]